MQDKRTKLAILSDNPLGPSGLGRIGRELAQGIAKMPNIELGYAALGGVSSRHLPYPLYPFSAITREREPLELAQIWQDFAGDEEGVLLTIWNHTWLSWLKDHPLRKKVKIWAYVPVDSTQADGKLPMPEVFDNFDRVLAYTRFGATAIEKTINRGPISHLPHGLDPGIFHPLDKQECRKSFGLDPDIFLVGIVATNHERKDWGLAFEVVSLLRKRGKRAVLWAHTDTEKGNWNLHDLAKIHEVPAIITTCHYYDERMCQMYGSCDVTLGIGHEGFGYPLAESLACGVPCITGDWAGQTEFVPILYRVPFIELHQFGPYSFRRPIFDPEDWADKAEMAERSDKSLLSPAFEWQNCFPRWQEWINQGL